jgi:hypothetical protein
MLNSMFSKLRPVGSRRRQAFKKILIWNSETPTSFEKSVLRAAEVDLCKRITSVEKDALAKLKDRYKGQRCFIIGNGPSLNDCDLSLLRDEYTFGVNGIFYKTDELGFTPSFYIVEDVHVVDDNLDRINDYEAQLKFFPSIYKDRITKTPNTHFFSVDLGFYRKSSKSYCRPRFSYDFSKVAFAGQSVTFINLQLAYYLGFEEVYLIGMDFSYEIPKSAIVRGRSIESTHDDPNHFHPDYFGKGKKWHDPLLDRVALNYELAKKVYEENDRQIFNATHKGALEIFDRVDFKSLFENT